jgi:pimeloyl-ACP methyl ester carboxylesterase
VGAQSGGTDQLIGGRSPPAIDLVTHPRSRPASLAVAVALLVALVAAACGTPAPASDAERFGGRTVRRTPGGADSGSGITAAAPSTTAPGGVTTTMKPPPYPVKVAPISCPFDRTSANKLKVDCANVVLPARRDKPDGAKVYLAVARIHSTSPTPLPDPVVYLDGGPGGSAIAGIDRWTNPVSPLLSDRDVILVDQRGTGFSQPRLNCDRTFAESPKGEFDERVEESKKCVADLLREKIDPADFNTTASAADIADVRVALKIEAWNLFGISYGTRLGLWIMATHPEGVRSVVLDSSYPPGIKGYEETAGNLNRALEAIFTDCAAQPACHAAYPDLRGALTKAVARLDASPLRRRAYDPATRKQVTFPYTGKEFVLTIFSSLYYTEIMPDVPKAISMAAQGDVVGAVDLLSGAGYAERTKEEDKPERPRSARQRPAITEGLTSAIECAETVPGTTPDSIKAAAASVPPSIADAVVLFRQRQVEACAAWNVPPNPLTEVHSAIPTLVMAGTYDPITPPAWGEMVTSWLPGSRMVTVQGAGHAAYYSGLCAQVLVKQFFDDPAAPSPDCTGAPPEFTR